MGSGAEAGHSIQLDQRQPGPALSFGTAVACIILVGLFLRPGIVAIGPLLPAIRDQFGLSHAEASLLIAIPDLLMGLLALPTPWLARRYGRSRLVLAALLLLLVSILARSAAADKAMLWIATAGVGAGIAICGALIAGFIKASFPARGAILTSIYATALALGSIAAAAISGPTASLSGGWRFGTGIWAVLGVTAIAAWIVVSRRSRPVGSVPGDVARLPVTVVTAWLVALYFACDNFLFYGCLSWIATIYRERGYGETQAGLILACFTAPLVIAPLIAGALSRGEDRRVQLALWSAIALAGMLLIIAVPDVTPYASVAILSLGIGGGFTLGMALPLDNSRTPEEAMAWNAFMLTIGYVIAAMGPFTVGALRDLTGGFSAALWLLAGVATLMLALSPFLRPVRFANGA